jgi:lipoprotein-anchoring transpeptidase ErfK/SrfK
MQKKILFIIAAAVGIVLCAFLLYRIFASASARCPAQHMKLENASREEEELFALAARNTASGDLLGARDAYRKILEKFPSSANAQAAKEALEDTNVRMLFSPVPTPDSTQYEVRKGDTLGRIARKFMNTQDMIMSSNGLKNAGVVPLGRKIKVHNERFSIVVDKSHNILTLKSADNIVKTYRVSTGVNNSTPSGTFKIINKITDPTWYTTGAVIPPGNPKNILGSRWLGLSVQSYGIHGTIEPASIGKYVTSGCVRMKNADVEELYRIVPEGTEVAIVD